MLSLVAAVGASVIVGALVVDATATPGSNAPAAGTSVGGRQPAATSQSGQTPTGGNASKAGGTTTGAGAAVAATTYALPRPGRYTYSAPGGSTVTQVAVSPAGAGAWRLDESVLVNSALVQRRQEAWTGSGVRVLAVWEAGQAQPCIWSDPPIDVVFPISKTSRWSVDSSCKVVNGSASQTVTHVRGSFVTSGPVRLAIAGQTVSAWLITGNEVTTVDGTVHGHRYHTVDNTTTRIWFLPGVGLPGRTELSGTVSITSDKGTTKHRIGQVTELESLTPQ